VSAPGLRLRGAVPPKEHNHEVSGNSDTDRVRNLDLPTSTGSTIAAALLLLFFVRAIYTRAGNRERKPPNLSLDGKRGPK